jgi:phage virion morphogenesis protein
MSGAKFIVEAIDSGIAAKIRAMQAAGETLEPLHRRIGAALVSNVQLGFKSSSSPYGQAWAPLKFRKGQPLRDTGRLRNSITQQPDSDGVTVGTNVDFAAVHQFGAVIKPVKAKRLVFGNGAGGLVFAKQVRIPARPFLPIDSAGNVTLPPSYQRTVINRIRAHFVDA